MKEENRVNTKDKKVKDKDNKEVKCPGCNEIYTDPPDMDWIECNSCKKWWHEACSNYNGYGVFSCDLHTIVRNGN